MSEVHAEPLRHQDQGPGKVLRDQDEIQFPVQVRDFGLDVPLGRLPGQVLEGVDDPVVEVKVRHLRIELLGMTLLTGRGYAECGRKGNLILGHYTFQKARFLQKYGTLHNLIT